MKILVNERLSKNKMKTSEGYLICTDAILARTGKQQYRKSEIWQDCDDADTIVDIDRPYEEVFSEATLASFENKPITVEHPDVDVNTSNYKDYSVGFVRDVHQGKVDGQDVILGTLVITDQQTIDEIENGEHTDLSCGYDCDIIDENNPKQTNIRGNHVALCQQGRAGIARIVDTNSIDDADYHTYKFEYETYEEDYPISHISTIKDTSAYEAGKKLKGNNIFIKRVYKDGALFKTFAGKYGTKTIRGRGSIEELKGLDSIKDNIVDSMSIDDLIEDEKEAIRGYEEAMKNASEKDKAIYAHIIKEELEHIEELKALKNYNTQDSIEVKDAPSVRAVAKEVWGHLIREGFSAKEILNMIKKQDSFAWNKLARHGHSDYFDDDNEVDEFCKKHKSQFFKELKYWFEEEAERAFDDDELEEIGFYDSVDIDDAQVDPSVVDTDNYVENVNGVWFARAKGESSLLSKAYCSSDNGKTWHTCTLETKSSNNDNRTQTGKYIFRTSQAKDYLGPRSSIGRNVLTWCSANKEHKLPNGYEIDHIDGDYTNDKLSNLQKVTHSENIKRMQAMKKVKVVNSLDASIDDVSPRSGESEDEFISRFMKETKSEYPDHQQRLAVAYSYWRNRNMKDEDNLRGKVATRDSNGEQFNIIKVPGDGFVYLQSRFDGKLIKTYEDSFKEKYTIKANDSIIEIDVGQGFSLDKNKFERYLQKHHLSLEEWGGRITEGGGRLVKIKGDKQAINNFLDETNADWSDDFRWVRL